MYIGMDTHGSYAYVVIVRADGRIVDETRLSYGEHFATLKEFAREHAGAEVAIEATGHYRPIYETLDAHMAVTLVNPAKTRAIAEAKVKNDRVDAKILAHLLRTDMLAESYVPPKEIRERRDLVRARKQFVANRTREKNRLQALLKRTGNPYRTEIYGRHRQAFLDDLDLSTVNQAVLAGHLAVIDTLDDQITALDREIEAQAIASREAELLMTIPSVSYFSALLITAEIGEIDRFADAKKLVSYAGLDPSVRQSGETERRGGITKQGSADLRWILVQCANTSVKYDAYLGEFYRQLKQRKNHNIAIVATARKLLVAIYHMLTKKEVYRPPQAVA